MVMRLLPRSACSLVSVCLHSYKQHELCRTKPVVELANEPGENFFGHPGLAGFKDSKNGLELLIRLAYDKKAD